MEIWFGLVQRGFFKKNFGFPVEGGFPYSGRKEIGALNTIRARPVCFNDNLFSTTL
jgi:hypothetical protein